MTDYVQYWIGEGVTCATFYAYARSLAEQQFYADRVETVDLVFEPVLAEQDGWAILAGNLVTVRCNDDRFALPWRVAEGDALSVLIARADKDYQTADRYMERLRADCYRPKLVRTPYEPERTIFAREKVKRLDMPNGGFRLQLAA
jgi:hypothetical protein